MHSSRFNPAKTSTNMSKIRKHIRLAEMAELLSRGAEQFKREVVRYAIPHLRLGDDQLFDPEEVVRFLSSQASDSKEVERKNVFLSANRLQSTEDSKPNDETLTDNETKSENLLSEKEAAEFLGVSKMTLLRRRKAKKIKHYRVGFRILYSKEKHLVPFLEANEI